MPDWLKWVPSEILSLFLLIPHTRAENLSWSCRRDFFREVLASDDDEECAFTCLSRATGGVWHDLSRVANLPEDLDVAFFPWTFSTSAFANSVSGWFCLSVTLLSSLLVLSSPSIVIVAPRRNGHFAQQMRLPVTLIRDVLRHVLVQEEVVARCQAVACHVYAWRLRNSREMKRIGADCWSRNKMEF